MVEELYGEPNQRKSLQELKQQFLEVGSVYFRETKGFLLKKNSYYLMPKERVFEVDDQYDLKFADLIASIEI